MQDNETAMTPASSLQLIESMINRAKDKFSENGHLYLLWGWVVLICSIIHFILLNYVRTNNAALVWLVTWIVAIYQIIYLVRNNKKRTVKTYTDDIVGYVWFAFIVAMGLMAFVVVRSLADQYYKIINPMFLILYGIPTFLSGQILRFKPLVVGGIACWLLAAVATFIPPHYQLLLLALAVIIAWIIPGYSLQSKFKKQQ